MPFWSSQTLKARIPAEQLVEPYYHTRVVHAAYEMGVGTEAFEDDRISDPALDILVDAEIEVGKQAGLADEDEVVVFGEVAMRALTSVRPIICSKG